MKKLANKWPFLVIILLGLFVLVGPYHDSIHPRYSYKLYPSCDRDAGSNIYMGRNARRRICGES